MEDFYWQKRVGQGSYVIKMQIVAIHATFCQGMAGASRTDYFIRADQGFLIDRFKIPFLGEADTVIKSPFGDMRLSLTP